jgi:hypothetical protein
MVPHRMMSGIRLSHCEEEGLRPAYIPEIVQKRR